MELPLSVTRAGAERVDLPGCTRNISSSGVLFISGLAAELGGPIEYVITLNETGSQPVNLRCMGKIVRSERLTNDDMRRSFEIAATLERYVFVRDRERELMLVR